MKKDSERKIPTQSMEEWLEENGQTNLEGSGNPEDLIDSDVWKHFRVDYLDEI